MVLGQPSRFLEGVPDRILGTMQVIEEGGFR